MENLGRPIRLQLASRVMTLAKDADWPDENQDCCRVDEARGLAAMADGVASAIFSRLWARILVTAAVDGLPDPADRETFTPWLAERRQQWSRQIDVSRLTWFQKPKLREGAFSTLLYVRLIPPGETDEASRAWRLSALAVGDTCLFLVRDGAVVRKFPIQTAAELECNPMAIGSIDLGHDAQIKFHRMEESCRPGDVVVLCTDAIAEWALRLEESDRAPAWQGYWDMPQPDWEAEIKRLRAERELRYDDATLALLRIVDADAIEPQPAAPAVEPAVETAVEPVALPGDEAAASVAAEQPETSEVSKTSEVCAAEPPAEPLSEPAEGAAETAAVAPAPPPEPPPVPSAGLPMPPESPSPAEHWTEKIGEVSELMGRQLSEGAAWTAKRLKKAGQSARSTLKKYFDKIRPDDRK